LLIDKLQKENSNNYQTLNNEINEFKELINPKNLHIYQQQLYKFIENN
jgi:hypothetical protein